MRVRDVCTSRKETVSEKCACDTESVYTPFLSGDVDHESYFFKKKNKLPLSAQIWAQRVRRSFFHESGEGRWPPAE